MRFLNIGNQVGTNVQESGAGMTTVETEASNGNENQVWVRPQRNRGIYLDVPEVLLLLLLLRGGILLCFHFTGDVRV